MKSTQDLVKFAQKISQINNKNMPVMIYPDKSFVVYEEHAVTGEVIIVYSSSDIGDGLDINDLAYEDPAEFIARIEQLSEAALLEEEALLVSASRDKFADL